MNALEAFTSALTNLSAHKLRSLLTMLGMIFGVGAVIAMLSIGAGAEQQSMELIDRMGIRNILVQVNNLVDIFDHQRTFLFTGAARCARPDFVRLQHMTDKGLAVSLLAPYRIQLKGIITAFN